jgi:hypothetical protein
MWKKTLIAVLTASTWVVGCASSEEGRAGQDEAAVTPPSAQTPFDQAELCLRNMVRHASIRPVDMQKGTIRWGCGDVPGVTPPDLGQEYCEYHAVQGGKIVTRASDLRPEAGKLSCVFTGVFTGAGQAAALEPPMSSEANLAGAVTQNPVVEMQVGFNSRGAATQLISDCARIGQVGLETRLRLTACYQKYAEGGANATQLKQICRGTNLGDAAVWARAQALGARVLSEGEPGFELQRDVAGCLAVRNAGLGWRNSDPMICTRAARAASECGCSFDPVPDELMGFTFTGWTNEQLPAGCRFAQVDDKPYEQLVICDASDGEVADIPLNAEYARSVASFCHDRFSTELIMKLPFRGLQHAGTCQRRPGFCADYLGSPAP